MLGALDVWVGLVEVRPLLGNETLEGDPGAFANALSLATDAADFRLRASAFFRGEEFEVVAFEHVERLEARGAGTPLPDEMVRLGERARETGEVQFDTYFTYRALDEQEAGERRRPVAGADEAAPAT
jgi:hypothetical protein